MPKLTIGVDFGGSSSKATLLCEDGKVLAEAMCEYPSKYPQMGWLEQDAEDLYSAMVSNIRTVLLKSGADANDIAAVAIDAATHMAVLCDENDKPLRPFIHWSDNRSTAQAARLRKEKGDVLGVHSVNSVSAAWTLSQLLWLWENEPETMKKVRRIYFTKDYIRHRITGDFCTDYIEAMGAMLADDGKAEWSPELCGIANVDVSMLPEIKAPADIAGFVNEQAAAETGLIAGTPVIVGATDTALEVYASGAVEPGCATVKLATAGRICPVTHGPVPSHQFFNYKHIIPGLWYPGTGTRSCAASYKWFRDVFGAEEIVKAEALGADVYELLNEAANEAPAGSGGLFFHPYLMGEMTPYYDDKLRASFSGISMFHNKGHFARAVMEGVAYSLKDCLAEITRQDVDVKQYRIIGGGAKGQLWRQIVADVLGVPLVYTKHNDSSLGSAMLAGVAAGVFKDYADSVEKCVKIEGTTKPNEENREVYEKGFSTYKRIQKALAGIYHDLS